jgi:hypothetical protein
MVARARKGALATLCVLAVVLGVPSAGTARQSVSELLITYVGSSSLRLAVNGSTVPNGGAIPADSYNVLVDDADYATPRFVLSGPAVNINSDLNSTGMGIDRPATFGPFTLQGSYTARDSNMGATLTFSASGTAAGGTTTGGSTTGGTAGGTGSADSSGSVGGSTSGKALGTLFGAVSAAGRVALTFGGKPVRSLKPGLYTITVADHSSRKGLVAQQLGFPALTLSGVAAIGSRSSKVSLSSGKWFVQATGGGPKLYFNVT